MIHRFDVMPQQPARTGVAGADPVGEAVRQQILGLGIDAPAVRFGRIFLIDSPDDAKTVDAVAGKLLADPIVEQVTRVTQGDQEPGTSRIEVHLKPGVMDPVAASTVQAMVDAGLQVREARTGRAYHIASTLPPQTLHEVARKLLANGVIENVTFAAWVPERFEVPAEAPFSLRYVPIRDLDEAGLKKLSREGHLFLSVPEMRVVQIYYKQLGREPTDCELETLAQTWSEHCVHKTLKSAVEVVDEQGTVLRRYGNLIKETIFGATKTLIERHEGTNARRHEGEDSPQGSDAPDEDPSCLRASVPSCLPLSVFKDNAGVIAFDDEDAVCFKVETHNHPSAIEPYGGAATGIGGVIRDILGTGLGAKPVANTDVFCVAPLDKTDLPAGVIAPARVLSQVVAGVRDYGNRMGIPTVNGAVYFDDDYVGNPLVFAGCVGIMPRWAIDKAARPGDAVVVMGGRTGRDGIHGATFSSAELTDQHADEFSHAVQIGNAITEKKVADVIIAARDRKLFTAVTDCGAGGLSSAVGEMGETIGAFVELSKVPLKYAGLRYDEIWISEAQERMVLSVPPEKLDELIALAKQEDVEATAIGTFGTENQELVLHYRGNEVARMSMDFLHNGIPMPERRAIVGGTGVSPVSGRSPADRPSAEHGRDAHATLLSALVAPNVASKHRIIRQYDHEVQGGSVIKPLIGPMQLGPSDAAVIRPKLASDKGVAIACGMAPYIEDPYAMAIASIDEAVRNAVCVGGRLENMAMLDNFCWPSCDDPETMGTLVRACEACRDYSLVLGIPFISGKDSLHNQYTDQSTGRVIRIPRTLLISTIGVLPDVRRCVTMDLKRGGNPLVFVSPADAEPTLEARCGVHAFVAGLIDAGKVRAAHDVSDGGLLVAAAEMAIAADLGLKLTLRCELEACFAEGLTGYLLELAEHDVGPAEQAGGRSGARVERLGEVTTGGRFEAAFPGEAIDLPVSELRDAWRGTP